MCGNGIRCAARYVYEKGGISHKKLRVKTLAGIIVPEIIEENGHVSAIRVDMGEPVLESRLIPVAGEGGRRVIGELLELGEKTFTITAVSMGNPHCIIYVPDVDKEPLADWGPAIEGHPFFPAKTNVEFVQVVNRREVKMRVWERGAGATLACGTGACAVAVAGVLNGVTDRNVMVRLSAGPLMIDWRETDNHVYMTGPAEFVFSGEYPI
jgi:diaminopimelate epimerase